MQPNPHHLACCPSNGVGTMASYQAPCSSRSACDAFMSKPCVVSSVAQLTGEQVHETGVRLPACSNYVAPMRKGEAVPRVPIGSQALSMVATADRCKEQQGCHVSRHQRSSGPAARTGLSTRAPDCTGLAC